jgi:hypothetical protein
VHLIEPHRLPVCRDGIRVPVTVETHIDGIAIGGFQPRDQLGRRLASALFADTVDDEESNHRDGTVAKSW